MIFEYAVKHNGVKYPAGADVPVGIEPKKQEPVIKPEEKAEKPVVKPKGSKRTKK
jgi:hypothetical protein